MTLKWRIALTICPLLCEVLGKQPIKSVPIKDAQLMIISEQHVGMTNDMKKSVIVKLYE